MTVRWTVRAAEDRARSSRENRVPIKNVAKQHKAPRLLPLYPLLRAVTLPMRATHAEQLPLNLRVYKTPAQRYLKVACNVSTWYTKLRDDF